MALNIRKFLQGLGIVPKASSTINQQGEMDVTSGDGKLNYHNGTSASPMVTEAHSATLTNKTLTDNSTVIADSTDALKQIKFDAGGTASTATTITAALASSGLCQATNSTSNVAVTFSFPPKISNNLFSFFIVTGKQIGRASCRERVLRLV